MSKYILCILFFLYLIPVFAQTADTIRNFDLTICEDYGCIAHEKTFASYHYENETLLVTFAFNDHQFLCSRYDKNAFAMFYDSLSKYYTLVSERFIPGQDHSSAAGIGSIKILVNGKIVSETLYMTPPDPGFTVRDWLIRKAKNSKSTLSSELILESKFYQYDCINDNAVISALNSMNPGEIKTMLYKSDNSRLHYCCLRSLETTNDSSLVGLLGKEIINTTGNNDNQVYLKELFRIFNKQDQSNAKNNWIYQFLCSGNENIQSLASEAVAKENRALLESMVLNRIDTFKTIRNKEEIIKTFSALTYFRDSNLTKKTIENYQSIIKKSNQLTRDDQFILLCYTATIGYLIDNTFYISYQTLKNKTDKMNLENEISTLNNKLFLIKW